MVFFLWSNFFYYLPLLKGIQRSKCPRSTYLCWVSPRPLGFNLRLYISLTYVSPFVRDDTYTSVFEYYRRSLPTPFVWRSLCQFGSDYPSVRLSHSTLMPTRTLTFDLSGGRRSWITWRHTPRSDDVSHFRSTDRTTYRSSYPGNHIHVNPDSCSTSLVTRPDRPRGLLRWRRVGYETPVLTEGKRQEHK